MNDCLKKSAGFFIASLMLAPALLADPVGVNSRPRMSSMGNAGVASMGDKDSALMNPAGLADITDRKWQVFPLMVEAPADYGVLSSYLDYEDVRKRTGATEDEKKTAFSKFIRDVNSTAAAMRVNLYPSYTVPHYHFGLLIDSSVEPRFHMGGLTSNQLVELGSSAVTGGLIFGTGWGFLENNLQVGVTVKGLYRVAVTKQQEQTLQDALVGQNSGTTVRDQLIGEIGDQRKWGIGVDLGVKYWVPTKWRWLEKLKPAVGITWQDIADTRFHGKSVLPENVKQSISMGFALHPEFGFVKTQFVFDLRNVNQKQAFMNKVHVGAEGLFWNLLAARVGFSQGYVTGGLGVVTRFFEADIFSNAYEAGDLARYQEIRTYGLRLAFTL